MGHFLCTYKKLAIIFYIIGEFFIYPLFAQSEVLVDYYTFRSFEEGKTRLEFYFSIDNSSIQFVRDGQNFSATFPTNLYLFDTIGQMVKSQSLNYTFSCKNYDETISPAMRHYFKFNLDVAPGEFRAVLILDDKNTNGPVKLEKKVHIPDYWDSLSISSLQLFSSEKQNRKIPSLKHMVFYTAPKMDVYYEAYNFDIKVSPKHLLIEYVLENEAGEIFHRQKEMVAVNKESLGFKTSLPIETLASGSYSLIVNQKYGDMQASTKSMFTVVQSPINLAVRPYKEVLDELRFVATGKELSALKAVPVPERQQAINSFWEKYDPMPGTENNELMMEYYSRIKQANKYFSQQKSAGLETDFGMVFMLFGKPDKVSGSRGTTRIWYYKDLGLKFTFVSRDKVPDFSLVDRGQVFADYMPR